MQSAYASAQKYPHRLHLAEAAAKRVEWGLVHRQGRGISALPMRFHGGKGAADEEAGLATLGKERRWLQLS